MRCAPRHTTAEVALAPRPVAFRAKRGPLILLPALRRHADGGETLRPKLTIRPVAERPCEEPTVNARPEEHVTVTEAEEVLRAQWLQRMRQGHCSTNADEAAGAEDKA